MGLWWEATVQQLCPAWAENLVKKTSVLKLVRNGTRYAGSMYGRRRETLSKLIIRSSLWPGWRGEGEMRLQPLFKYRIITERTSDIMAVALIQTTGPVWAITFYSTNNTACSLNRNVQFFLTNTQMSHLLGPILYTLESSSQDLYLGIFMTESRFYCDWQELIFSSKNKHCPTRCL